MHALARSASIVLVVAVCFAGRVAAQVECVDSSYAFVTFAGGKDRITIAPNGGFETLAGNGITIHVYMRNCQGVARPGISGNDIVVWNVNLCLCSGGYHADADTDENGHTTFTGVIRGGGCVESLDVFGEGVHIATVPVKTNSPDDVSLSPCHVDMSEVGVLSSRFGNPSAYTICGDWNESGAIDAGEVAYLAAFLGAECQ